MRLSSTLNFREAVKKYLFLIILILKINVFIILDINKYL